MQINKYYIDVVLPLPIKGVFTYSFDEALLIGQRVIVQFGVRKLYSAVVCKVHQNAPKEYNPKDILAIIDEPPIVNQRQLDLWFWISDYYMCNVGDVMNAALPSLFKLTSISSVIIHPDFEGDIDHLDNYEQAIINALLEKEELSIDAIYKLIDRKDVFSYINQLIRKEVIQIKEELHDKYQQKKIKLVRCNFTKEQISSIVLTEKQRILAETFLRLQYQYPKKRYKASELLNKIHLSRGVFDALIQKGVFSIEEKNISRLVSDNITISKKKVLADFQKKALKDIQDSFKERDVCLLHGVTSSGKTELYIKLIEEQLKNNKQVLYLLPEIALTTQIIKRLRGYFGNNVGITHSHLNNSERVEVWRAVQEKDSKKVQYPIILGARSSLFLPFDDLGLIIVDEEHDMSFKQQQPAPRYHARDTAIYLAHLHKSKVLLGSATPCLETYYNVRSKKYSLVEMHQRYANIELPNIHTIDIRKAYLKKRMNNQFSPEMINSISETLKSGKQVILFQNRRGYSPIINCIECAYTPSCKSCDVTLTYYKWNNTLKCHYCGYTEDFIRECPSCQSKEFIDQGFGTEQIEESLNQIFPDFVISRLDHDTTRRKFAYQKIITDFEQGRIDILVGTQMVAKGLDFDNVALVGILNADSMLCFPDFRAYERGFQLLMQVSGRAGRKDKRGKVLVQTYDEEREIFGLLKAHDYNTFLDKQLVERKIFSYPPYTRLIGVNLKHKNERKLDDAAKHLGVLMRNSFGDRVLGPEYPYISKIRNYYHKNLLLKIEQKSSIQQAKEILSLIIYNFNKHSDYKSIRCLIDVDVV